MATVPLSQDGWLNGIHIMDYRSVKIYIYLLLNLKFKGVKLN